MTTDQAVGWVERQYEGALGLRRVPMRRDLRRMSLRSASLEGKERQKKPEIGDWGSEVRGRQHPEVRSRISDLKMKQLRLTTNNGQLTNPMGIAILDFRLRILDFLGKKSFGRIGIQQSLVLDVCFFIRSAFAKSYGKTSVGRSYSLRALTTQR